MDIVDRDLEKAERDASPDRFSQPKTQNGPPLERFGTAASGSTSSSSSSTSSAAVVREEIGMSRIQTGRDLERHPTELSRIETHRSQHSGTVGRSLRSRESRKPLPNFGGGKEYPPPLPEREEYVVEFDGPGDPLHPQNWPMKKKYVANRHPVPVELTALAQDCYRRHARIHHPRCSIRQQYLLSRHSSRRRIFLRFYRSRRPRYLVVRPGIRDWSHPLGAPVRASGQEVTPDLLHARLLHLLRRNCHRQGSPNRDAHPLLRRRVRLLSPGRCRCCLLRHV